MFQNLHPKCANPACATAFDWLAGGKFFRFHRDHAQVVPAEGNGEPSQNVHHVEHFWLCEHCAQIYTLGYEPGRGVLLRLLWPEFPDVESTPQLPAA